MFTGSYKYFVNYTPTVVIYQLRFFSEFLEHTNYTFHTNGTLSYFPKRTVKFIPEKSIGDPKKDIVTVPNIPYLGASSAAADMSVFAGKLKVKMVFYL